MENDIYTTDEKQISPTKKIKILLAVLIIFGLIFYGGYSYYASIQEQAVLNAELASEALISEQLDIQTELNAALEASISGYLLVDVYTAKKDDTAETSAVVQVSLDGSNSLEILTRDSGTKYLVPNSTITGTGVQYDKESEMYRAMAYNLDTSNFIFLPSPQGDIVNKVLPPVNYLYLSDSFEEDVYDSDMQGDLDYWKVSMGNYDTNEMSIIPEASSPQWIEEGVDVALIQSDGIYRFNAQTKVIEKIFGGYTNLSGFDELAVSPDGKYVIVTMPRNNAIGVLGRNLDDSEGYDEIERIQTESVEYHSPIFDPTGKFFAVVKKDLRNDMSDITIYSVVTGKVIKEIILDEEITDTAVLSAWSDTPLVINNN